MKEEKFVYQIQAEGKDYFVVATSYNDAIEKWLKLNRMYRQVNERAIYAISIKGAVID